MLLIATSTAAEDDWVTYTSANLARRMLISHDSLFVVTSGGVLITEPDLMSQGKILTNLDGLGTTDLTDIIQDAQGQKWIAADGRLLKFSPNATEQFLFQDNENNLIRLQCLADDGNYVWVGYPAGVVLFNKAQDGGLIQDSYQMFGSLPASPSVSDVLIVGDSIWLATSAGLAVADKSDPRLLKLSSSWKSFNVISNPELGSATVRRLAWFKNQLLAATSSGLFRLDRLATDTVFTELAFNPTSNFTDLRIERDTLFTFSSDGLGVMVDSTAIPLSVSGLPSAAATGAGNGAHFWVGSTNSGIYRSDTQGVYSRYEFTGMPDNDVVDVAISEKNHVNVAFSRKPMAEMVDDQWVSQSYSVGSFATRLFAGQSGTRWAGTFGAGMWKIGNGTPQRFDTTGTTLRGNNDPGGKNYIVITGIAGDGPHLFVSCFRAYDGNPIAFARLDQVDSRSGWGAFGTVNGITDTFIVDLDYGGGYLAAATDANGLYLYFVGPDPFDISDDTCHYLNHANSGLRSDIVRVVKFAPDSSLWVGTNYGLSHYDRGIDRFVDVNLPAGIGPDITDIDFDSRGVLWVSARNGIARFDQSSGAFRTIHAISSGLVSDDVRSLTVNRNSGDLWVGTSAGVSELRFPVTSLTESIDSVWAFPNPFVISSSADSLSVNYAFPGTVSIFDVSGALVDEFPVRAGWHGTNRAGKPVASGVYLFVIQNATGQVGRGKFLLVRQ
ncbi:hypothetical protein C3F09_02865 [candidate division GN15 bacterium]|uniref:T9SS type A sorting domain-containing protein n=1 Tax=candidate division GN15 bacterium TaxID=2072418 RepID=A0A855X646_9BACT|nr:MAG: hypothetical protein C3F09_02865 [candidate division GN15 bacterium]